MRAPSLKSADFQRALGTRPVARTEHFSLHILPRVTVGAPASVHAPADTAAGPLAGDSARLSPGFPDNLSTGEAETGFTLVDDSSASRTPVWRLGLVLPKKQARRSVTRSLMRHQAREAFRRHAEAVRAAGRHGGEVDGWVLRLRAPFDRKQFPSAASAALSAAVRMELDALWARLARAQA